MIKVFHSFYSKLSLIFLILILFLGAGSLVIAFNAAGLLFDEVEQLLNREYAASIALEIQPIVKEGFSVAEVQDAIHYMMVLNPMVEIYLLNHSGDIIAFFTGPGDEVIRQRINLNPLKIFIDTNGREPVLGDDPRTENKVKPFSAAPLLMGEEKGFVYVILRGQSYDRSLEMLRNSYYLQTGLSTFFFALIATLIAGLSLFSLLTRRLRHLSSAVNAFEKGDYNYRVNISGSDELSALGRAFNEMASSIDNGINQRRDLIANISHDLRSPLTSIRAHLETILLKDQKLSETERKEYLEISLKNVSSFQKLVEELFELAKLESHQVKIEKEPFQITELAQDVVLKLKQQAIELDTQLTIDLLNEIPVFNGDIGMIERIFTNIIENALSHTPEKGTINIQISSQENRIKIGISDTGLGIPEEDLPHIFERFYRADKSRDRRSPGTGLGLAITKEIVELHGGTISAQSKEGKGAEFIILLPL
ncbi:MAG: HAMP domain-containing sensor histidine kinase [Spirochaetaceae bacterium]|jgi:signal transduction histidine kinase|nr:HAMP domain-containing sensor histidine kinase [Spirochaetaceae bacterium]